MFGCQVFVWPRHTRVLILCGCVYATLQLLHFSQPLSAFHFSFPLLSSHTFPGRLLGRCFIMCSGFPNRLASLTRPTYVLAFSGVYCNLHSTLAVVSVSFFQVVCWLFPLLFSYWFRSQHSSASLCLDFQLAFQLTVCALANCLIH